MLLLDEAVFFSPSEWHTITARETPLFHCCCAPPYSHEDTYFA